MNFNFKNLFIASAALILAQAANATPITWSLSGVTFSDGATASGSITWDADTQIFSNWDITVTAGSLTAYEYLTSNSSGANTSLDPGFQNTFQMSVPALRDLWLTPVAALTDAGGNVAIDLSTYSGGALSVECPSCTVSRTITAGSLTADTAPPTPEPASRTLLGLGFIALALLTRKPI